MTLAANIARNNAEVRARRRLARSRHALDLLLAVLPLLTGAALFGGALFERWF